MIGQNLVELEYLPAQPKILGPSRLMMSIDLILTGIGFEAKQNNWSQTRANVEAHHRIDALFDQENWFVRCGITGEAIPYTSLRYWNVEKQIAYARPELIPQNHFNY